MHIDNQHLIDIIETYLKNRNLTISFLAENGSTATINSYLIRDLVDIYPERVEKFMELLIKEGSVDSRKVWPIS